MNVSHRDHNWKKYYYCYTYKSMADLPPKCIMGYTLKGLEFGSQLGFFKKWSDISLNMKDWNIGIVDLFSKYCTIMEDVISQHPKTPPT